jgi:hypothetical protein
MPSTLAALAIALVVAAPLRLGAVEVTVAEVVQGASGMDGEVLTVDGELVGDYGSRGDGWMWTQLNGDVYVSSPIIEGGSAAGGNVAIGIRMPIALAQGLDPPGRYRIRGPLVRVTGIWRYHDPQRGGETYLEVQSLTVIEPGRPLEEEPDWLVVIVGGSLVAAAAAGWLRWKQDEAQRE